MDIDIQTNQWPAWCDPSIPNTNRLLSLLHSVLLLLPPPSQLSPSPCPHLCLLVIPSISSVPSFCHHRRCLLGLMITFFLDFIARFPLTLLPQSPLSSAQSSTPTTALHPRFFQWAFASATCTIVSGAGAERCSFSGYLISTMLLSTIVCKSPPFVPSGPTSGPPPLLRPLQLQMTFLVTSSAPCAYFSFPLLLCHLRILCSSPSQCTDSGTSSSLAYYYTTLSPDPPSATHHTSRHRASE